MLVEATHEEVAQLPCMPPVHSPGLACIPCIQECWKDGHCVNLQLCEHSNSSQLLYWLYNPSVDFITSMHSLREGAAKIGESVHGVETCSINVTMGSVCQGLVGA